MAVKGNCDVTKTAETRPVRLVIKLPGLSPPAGRVPGGRWRCVRGRESKTFLLKAFQKAFKGQVVTAIC